MRQLGYMAYTDSPFKLGIKPNCKVELPNLLKQRATSAGAEASNQLVSATGFSAATTATFDGDHDDAAARALWNSSSIDEINGSRTVLKISRNTARSMFNTFRTLGYQVHPVYN